MKAEICMSLWDVHNSYLLVHFLLNLGLFLVTILGYKHIFFCWRYSSKLDGIDQVICFGYVALVPFSFRASSHDPG